MSRFLGIIATLAILIALGWAYHAPYRTWQQMREAAELNDAAALSEHVNFPSVKESIKANFSAKLAGDATKNPTDSFEALGTALASALVAPIVELLVTPQGLVMLMNGQMPEPGQRDAAAGGADSEGDRETRMGYESLDRFVVTVERADGKEGPIAFVLRRYGLLEWKLAALRF